jgi:hypothetical protein
MNAYADLESLVQNWLKLTDLALLLTRPDGGVNVFKAMPNKAPLPAIVLSRVGGAPLRHKDVPEDVGRISFDCWGQSRDDAIEISMTLVAELENLAYLGGFVDGNARLCAAETLSWLWLPDRASDNPRYVVDANMTAITG